MHAADSVLLRRIQTVYVDHDPAPAGGPGPALRRLEAELLGRGCTVAPGLHAALAGLGSEELASAHTRLVGLVDGLLGSDRTHRPLFRGFPGVVPRDTEALYLDRVFAHLLQRPDQPCVLCGAARTVRPLSPCAHLVCGPCWGGGDYDGCPICHRRTDATEPFLRAVRAVGAARPATEGPLRLLRLGTDRAADATALVEDLLARRTPLSPQDRHDLLALLPLSPVWRGLLPAEIPVRETKALVVGTLMAARPEGAGAAVRALTAERLTTATDVLRVLAVLSGGDAGLQPLPRFGGLPRRLRRELLGVLDGLPVPFLVEDVLRHPTAWKRAAETLHPFEGHPRHPRAALAFAVLRATPASPGTALGAALLATAAAHPDAVRMDADGGRIRPATWAGRLEQALAAGDLGTAAAIAAQRPGELVRRLDHLLRVAAGGRGTGAGTATADGTAVGKGAVVVPEGSGSEGLPAELADALSHGLPKVGPGPLLSALGALRVRTEDRTGGRRVFFPAGEVTRALAVPETRPPLPGRFVAEAVALLEGEVLRRFASAGERTATRTGGAGGEGAGAAPPASYDLAVLDTDLADLTVPFTERATAKALVAVPRGSRQPVPAGEVLRLFLHWTEPAGERTDLDLSVAFFDADWGYVGLCDYTSLRFAGDAAVHSGDLTSAPAPAGATEYVDLDPEQLAGHGVRYAVPLVFSFNNIPFDELPDAFAGFMALPADRPRGARYDPRSVRQRFDLAGESRICLPMVVDLERRRSLWTDVHLPPAEGYQSIAAMGPRLGEVVRDVYEQFGAAARVTLWDLTVWRAAARTREVAVLRRAGHPGAGDELWTHRRRAGEPVAAFAHRIAGLSDPDRREPVADVTSEAARLASGRRVFLATVHGGPAPERAAGTVYRLFPGAGAYGPGFRQATAGDLVAELG
ncbi:RING finger family 4 domain-containing protein [Streptomyces sp. NPDC093225]|uniref:RING finger family 4 domain-containing protein n=1 Tax=Streptomyces sp. NPDC093225 TaxID=3366034 RepID=UPI0038156D05